MLNATYTDKQLVIDILSSSFEDNKSVNYIVTQDGARMKRIRQLMNYSFCICYRYGEVLFSEDKKAVALILYPEKQKSTFSTILLNIKLIACAIGLKGLKRVLRRESEIKKAHPSGLITYLWFIGVMPSEQNKGAGTFLLKEILKKSKAHGRSVILETSTERNIPWYHKNGLTTYKELDFGYKLFCMKSN